MVVTCLGKNKDYVNGLTEQLASWQDGFAYIPDNVHVKDPFNCIRVNSNENILIQPRNVISIGDNASVSIVHCDDSLETKETLINTVTEIYVGKAAQCDYFKLENKDNQTTLINHLLIHQEEIAPLIQYDCV